MKRLRYRKLKKDIIIVTLIVSVAPLIFLGFGLYYQFANVFAERTETQIKSLVRSHRSGIDVFLRERTSILTTIVDTHSFAKLSQPQNLAEIFKVINRRADGLGLVDMGIIDSAGNQLVYVGPYDLKGLNYYQQPWFSEVMSKGRYISDVYMGYRQVPHFIIAVRGHDEDRSYILRATIDSEVFNRLVRTAHTGQRGDAFIVNKEGYFQTNPRFHGAILSKSDLDTNSFAEDTVNIKKLPDGTTQYYAGSWLKNGEWLLIISQEAGEEIAGLKSTLNRTIFIVAFACLAIVATILLTANMAIKRLEGADRELDELNSQLIQSDKMAALGKMAAGIAHEINNPLAVIGEKAGWMRDLLAEENFQQSENFEEYQRSIEKIEEHVERARKITHNMLGFARRMEPRLDDVDVNGIINQTLELLKNHARINNIEIRKDLQSDLPVIASDQSQLQQVLLNLFNNAIDAIGKDGVIDLATVSDNRTIEISIKDSGSGIPAAVQRRIFDPFFTTKGPGRGTGLGLSISYGIIEKMGGTLTFTSGENEGTTFVIRLPIKLPEKK
ncbi:MAG: ATP-binding protein [Desulfobacterales bacterium]